MLKHLNSEAINIEKIDQYFTEQSLPLPLDLHLKPVIDSTNDYLKEKPLQKEQLAVCLAEQQTAGRGRFGRVWHSPYGQNIYMSLRLPWSLPVAKLSGISLCLGLSVIAAFEQAGLDKEKFRLKWPNDILLNNNKVAGILVELVGQANDDRALIIGLGVNVNMAAANIDKAWTSLRLAFEQNIDRTSMIIKLISSIINYIEHFKADGLAYFINEWQQYDALKGCPLVLSSHQHQWTGEYLGIDDKGNIKLRTADGAVQTLSSGEVSIKQR